MTEGKGCQGQGAMKKTMWPPDDMSIAQRERT